MPAAAVIPAPIAYIKVVAVKKLVVGSRALLGAVRRLVATARQAPCSVFPWYPSLGVLGCRKFYFEEISVFKAGICLNVSAWNNRIGPWFYFVGFRSQGNG